MVQHTQTRMSKDAPFYRVIVGENRLVGSTSISSLPGLLEREPSGRYVIEEVTAPRGFLSTPVKRRWGWAIKHADGRVDLEPDDAGP